MGFFVFFFFASFQHHLMKILSARNKYKSEEDCWEKKSIQSDTLENAYKDKHFSLNLSHILFLMHQSSAIVPSFHIAADAWNQLPADIRTSSSLLKFKDSTRHYTSPGRQLSLRHNCCCFMFPDSLSRAAQLHVPFEASLHLSDSNFNSSEQKNREDSSFLSVFNRAQWETGERKRGVGGGHNHSPVEMSCSCDQCPSKVRLQRCIFSSDGSQDRQIMRSQPSSYRGYTAFGSVFLDSAWDHMNLSHFWLQSSPTLLILTPR